MVTPWTHPLFLARTLGNEFLLFSRQFPSRVQIWRPGWVLEYRESYFMRILLASKTCVFSRINLMEMWEDITVNHECSATWTFEEAKFNAREGKAWTWSGICHNNIGCLFVLHCTCLTWFLKFCSLIYFISVRHITWLFRFSNNIFVVVIEDRSQTCYEK